MPPLVPARQQHTGNMTRFAARVTVLDATIVASVHSLKRRPRTQRRLKAHVNAVMPAITD